MKIVILSSKNVFFSFYTEQIWLFHNKLSLKKYLRTFFSAYSRSCVWPFLDKVYSLPWPSMRLLLEFKLSKLHMLPHAQPALSWWNMHRINKKKHKIFIHKMSCLSQSRFKFVSDNKNLKFNFKWRTKIRSFLN